MDARTQIRSFETFTSPITLISDAYELPEHCTVKATDLEHSAILFFSKARVVDAKDTYVDAQIIAHQKYQEMGRTLLYHEWTAVSRELDNETIMRERLSGKQGLEKDIEVMMLKLSLAKHLLLGKLPKKIVEERGRTLFNRYCCYNDTWHIINNGIAEIEPYGVTLLVDAAKESRDITRNLCAVGMKRLGIWHRTKEILYN